MKLSIVVPVYNEMHFVGEALRQVISQRVDGIDESEIIVINDGSTDGTASALETLTTSHKKKIRIVNHRKNPHLLVQYANKSESDRHGNRL